MRALQLIDQLRTVSAGAANFVLSTALPQVIPFAGGLGIQVRDLNDTRAEASLPLKRRTRNHVGSVYFGAQMTLMELTMGLLLFRLFPPGPYGMLVKRVEGDFHAKAKGAVRAVCEPPAELLQGLRDQLKEKGDKAEAWIPVKLVTKDGTTVTEARFHAALKKF